MGKDEQHRMDTEILGLHHKSGSIEGGACLTGHEWENPVKVDNSCSYRWQAIERAINEDSCYYNGKRPTWDVTLNGFRWGATRPYSHQAHHLIPQGVLAAAMLTTAEASSSTLLVIVLRMSLLLAKYNINHKDNMMLLPTKAEVSRILGLPRHLGSHPNYDALVTSKLQTVIDDYAQLLEDAIGEPNDHPAAPDELSKAKLMRVSEEMRVIIFGWAQEVGGMNIDEHARVSPPRTAS